MKKKTIVFLACLTALLRVAQAQSYISLGEARSIAEAYYGSLQMIVADPRGDGSVDGQKRLYEAVGKDNHGNALGGELPVPNDLGYFLRHTEGGSVRLANYVGSLRDMATDYGFTLQFRTLKCDYLHGPEMKANESDPTFARVVVGKTISSTRFARTTVDDTLYVDAHTKAIALVTNRFGTTYRQDVSRMDYANLKPYAARMYADKNYDEAFRAYERILQIYPADEEASYSLGVMCFKGQGCTQYPRKVRDYMAEFYWQKSLKGHDRLKETYNRGSKIHFTCYSNSEPAPFICNRMLIIDKDKNNGNRYGYMSPKGDVVIKQEYSLALPFFDNGTALVCTTKGQWLMIDTNGRVKDIYGIEGFQESWATFAHLFVRDQDGKRVIINRRTGEIESPSHYDGIMWSYFAKAVLGADKGLFVVSHAGSYGLVVPQYGEVIPCKYRNMELIKWEGSDYATLIVDYDEKALESLKRTHVEYSKIPFDELAKIGTPVSVNWANEGNGHLYVVYFKEKIELSKYEKTRK